MIHELKLNSEYFPLVREGIKTFEIRKNDRDFRVGDILRLREWINSNENGDYDSGGFIDAEVLYITNFMQVDDYVVMAIKVHRYEGGWKFRE
jgi:hypothetical protein